MGNTSISEQLEDHLENRERLDFARQVDREAVEAERADVEAFIEARALTLNARGDVGDTFRVDECFRLLRGIRDGKHARCAKASDKEGRK
jgi:hypothetical protein